MICPGTTRAPSATRTLTARPPEREPTITVWDSSDALNEFAHRREPHVEAIRRTNTENWYAEELFARFEVLALDGTFAGQPV